MYALLGFDHTVEAFLPGLLDYWATDHNRLLALVTDTAPLESVLIAAQRASRTERPHMFKPALTTLTLLITLLTAPGVYIMSSAQTTYQASDYGLEGFVAREDKPTMRKAFEQLNKGEFIKARYQFQDLARDNPAAKPFWESALYLMMAPADLCEAWWLSTINKGFDYTLAQRELQYLMPLNSQAQCINSVAQSLRAIKTPTRSQADWLWQQLPSVAQYFTPARLTLAKAYEQGFGNQPNLAKSAQWFLATFSDDETLSVSDKRDIAISLAKILFKLAEQEKTVNPSMANELYKKSYAYAAQASGGTPKGYIVSESEALARILGKEEKQKIIEQVQDCQNKAITQCAFYSVPAKLNLRPLVPLEYPRHQIIEQLMLGHHEIAFEYAKRAAQYNWPVAWASELYASLVTKKYDAALFRLSYLSFESSGLDNPFVSAIAAQLDSQQQAKRVIMYAAAAVLSSRNVDAATGKRAIDYLERYTHGASPQELLYLSQIFSRPLTPAYNIEKAIHLAARSFKAQPELAASVQLAHLYSMKSEEQWQDERDAWRLIAIGLLIDNLAGVFEDFEADRAAVKSKSLASECQTAGLTTCDLLDASLALYNQAWPMARALSPTSANDIAITAALETAMGTYIAVDDSGRINDLDKLMREHKAPVFVPNIASDMQVLDKPSYIAMRYTLFAGALGKGGDWAETLVRQSSALYDKNTFKGVQWRVGQVYGDAAGDIMEGFPLKRPQLAKLFYEAAVLAGRAKYAVIFADRLRLGKGFDVDNTRALKLYEYALQQQRLLVFRNLIRELPMMTDITNHKTKAYAYALIARSETYGPLISEQHTAALAKNLSSQQKEQAQRWAKDCIDKNLYLCDLYEPNNLFLQLPVTPPES